MIDIKLKSIIDSMRKESEQQACQTQHNLLDNKYRMLLDNAPLPIVAFKVSDGVIGYLNQSAKDYFLYDENKDDCTIVTQYFTDPSEYDAYISKLNRDGRAVNAELELLNFRGDVYWALVSASIIEFQGEPTIIATVNDISERKKLEEQIRSNEETLRTFIENAPAAIAMLDNDMRYIATSKRFRNDFNINDESIIGRSYYEVIPDIPEEWKEAHKRGLSGKAERFEAEPFQRSSGEVEWVYREIHPWYRYGGQIGGIIILDEMVTEQLATMLNYDKQDIFNSFDHLIKTVHPDDREEVFANTQRITNGVSSEYNNEYRIQCKDGTYKWVLDRGRVMGRDDEGTPLRIIGTLTDINRYKKTQASLERKNMFLRLIRSCHDILVRSTESEDLMNGICSTIMTHAKYSFSWIGLQSEECKDSMLTIVSPEDNHGFLSNPITLTNYNNAAYTCPMKTAIQTGEPVVVRHKEACPPYSQWWRKTISNDYGTVLALPIIYKDCTIGALNIYSVDSEAFNNEELMILLELAKDLAYGISALRTNEKHTKAMADLALSEERYRTLFETANEGILIADPVTQKMEYANPAMCNILGYTADELTKLHVSELSHEDDLTYVLSEFQSHLDGAKTLSYAIPLMKKDRSRVILETFSTMVVINGKRLLAGFFTDQTEMVAARKEQMQAECKLRDTLEKTVEVIAKTVELRDPYTSGHQERVASLAEAIAIKLNLSSEEIKGIHMAAIVHDLGKIYVPSEILSKPGRLNEIEYALIKTHAQAGFDILKEVDFPWPVSEMVLQHHERIDGSGYPRNLKGSEILIGARILHVADVVEAISSHRPYRPALGVDTALKEISDNSGKYYDKDVVDACIEVFKDGYQLEHHEELDVGHT